jgi:hypothetical protein
MRRKIWVILFLTFVAAWSSTDAYGTGNYLSQFNTRYSTTGTALDTCITCHTTPPALNSYGSAFAAGHNFATI